MYWLWLNSNTRKGNFFPSLHWSNFEKQARQCFTIIYMGILITTKYLFILRTKRKLPLHAYLVYSPIEQYLLGCVMHLAHFKDIWWQYFLTMLISSWSCSWMISLLLILPLMCVFLISLLLNFISDAFLLVILSLFNLIWKPFLTFLSIVLMGIVPRWRIAWLV